MPPAGPGARRRLGEPVGVGPHPQPWPTIRGSIPQLLAEGDRRNVVDHYRYWTIEAIVADLDTPADAVPRGGRELAARPEHRDGGAQRQRVPGRGGAHRRASAAGTGAAPWSPTATSTSCTIRRSTTLRTGPRTAGLPLVGIDLLPGSRSAAGGRAAAPLRAASSVRRGRGCRARPASAVRSGAAHPAVRLDPVDQRGGRQRHRDVRMVPPIWPCQLRPNGPSKLKTE